MTPRHLRVLTVLLVTGCAAGEVFHTMDACPGATLCDQLDEAFNVSGVYATSEEHRMYCHMESGRWTEILRRGQDAAGTALPVADHQSLAPGQDPDPMVVGFGDAVDGEFYIGNQELANKLSLLPPWSVQLKVSLLGQNGVRYFSVFNNFHAYSDPLRFSITTLQYRMGTAGDGQLAALDNAIYNGACTPTAWFGTGASCDAAVDQGPALTLPLTDTDQRNGRTPWPTLPVQLKAISLQIRNGQAADACPGLEQNFNFDGDVLDNIENTVPESVGPGDSFTITCKNSSWILPTQANAAEAIPNSVTFTCVNTTADPAPVDHRMDNWPLVTGKPCMAPCPANYTLYVPGTNTKAMESTPDRVTCLSPPSTEPAKSAMDAAARCGEKGEQLLDFVPKPSFLPGLDTSQPHWLWMQQLNGYNQQLNSREEVSGSYNDGTFQCVQVNYSGTQPFLVTAQCHSDWRGTNPYRNFVCMTAVGCGPDAVFHAGSCYKYLQSVLPNDHVRQCLNSGGTPADYTASFVAEALPQLGVPTGSPATPLVGIYRRYGKFWRPDGSLVPEDEFDGATYGDQTLQCAAPLPTDPTKLTAIDCAADTVNHGVICQMAAHVSAALDPCSVRYDQLLNASSTGPMPQLVQTSNLMPTATLGDEVTFTCPDGFNMHNLTDFHSVLLICQGFVSGWLYPAQMDVALHGQPLQCIFACDVSESVTPLNSELVTEGPDQVFRCLAPMQTAAGSTDQLVVCDHQTGQLDASSLKPCDHCLMHPLIPDELSGFTSSWDNVTRLEGTTVTYTCLSGLQTPAGDTLQNQTCTANGWEGEVVPCSQCAPLDEDVQLRAALASLEGPQLFGALANVSCPSNIESGNGSLSTSVICMPSGWSWCIGDFNCSYCSGSPPNVSAMATITSDWDGEQRTFNTTVLYSCSAGLETVDGATEQTANCTETGWQDGVLPCDVCSNPPNGSHPTISATQPTGNGTLGSSLKFVCNSGLSQIDGATSILSVCTETGWTNCSEDIKCEYCTPLPNLPDGTMDWGSYAGERTLGTEVTLTCGDGLAIPGSLKKTQTVVCDMDGWNHTDVKSCTVCDKEPPAPASDMTLAWTLGDSQAVYQCPNDTMLPWGLTSYRMLCSPDGWSDCVPECSACVFAPPAGPGVVMTSQNVSRGGTANYECRANMTSAGATELELSCTETGWTDAEMITCDRCASEPAEAGPAQNRTGNVTSLIGNTLQYQCAESMITAAGLTEQSVNCSDNGWSEPPAPCDHCILPAAPNSTAQTWDLSENVTEGRVPVGTNITFFCSNVTSTLVSNSSNLTLSCGADGWSGEPEPCVSCLGAIPDPGNGTDARNVTWDGGRQDGALVLYTCQNGAQHEVVCTDREWLPAQLGSCVVPTTEPTGEFDVVTKATYDDKYPITTNYYWATINAKMTSTHGDDTWSVGKGPAGFEDSLILESGCMSHQKWPSRRDQCASNPVNCEKGFSFSLWARIEMESIETQFNGTANTKKRYLISTGGDDQGSPGVAIFVQSHALHALVSTGSQYWETFVVGQLLSQRWFNVGVRWSPTAPFEVPGSSAKLPGLQLYINSSPMARTTGPSAAKASAKEALNPAEVLVGCHRTSDNTEYRDFCSGEFDEVAMWTRLLPANESIYFLGGYDERDKHITMDSMLDRLRKNPDLIKSPKMFRAYIDQMQKAMKTDAAAATVGSTAASGTAGAAEAEAQPAAVDLPEGTPVASPEEVGKVHALVQLVEVMTKEAKDPVQPDELPLFMSLLKVVGSSLNMDTLAQWRNIEYTYKEDGGAASVVVRFDDWVLKLASNMDLGGLGDNFIHEQTEDNVELALQRTWVYQLRQKPVLTYPIGAKNRLNSVQVASDLFNNPDTSECRFVGVSMLYVFYNTLGHVSPQRYSTLDLHAETSDLELEGGVVSIKFDLKSDDPGLVANCTPTDEKLRKYPIQTSIAHTTQSKAKRGILFHEGEINTGILRRACVWWNPTLSDYGGWDTDGCKAVDYSDFHTKCACAHFGQIAIVVQKEPPKIVDLEFMWLKIIKYICYSVSALLLIVFIAAVIKIKALHEMFHLMRLNTAVGLLLGSVLMVMTDIPEIRADRHTCTGFAGAIHFFYLLAATMVMLEGIADFISVTSGAIGGKLKSYVAFAWGVPFLSLGYAMLMHLPDYGTDPRCMLGWPDQVKMTMFMPLIVLLSFTFLITCLVSCNMQASRLRKENIVAEQLTVCKGFVFFSFYFVCTWIVGLIAYLRLGLSIPSFYPLFQILNSTGGIIFFLFCGIGSERFWLLIAGKSDLRKKMLFSYTVTEQLSESKQNLVEKEPSRPATPEDDQEEFDPEAYGPRGPVAA